MVSITINYSIMNPPGNTYRGDKSSPDKPEEEASNHLDSAVFEPSDLDQTDRMDSFHRSESSLPNHAYYAFDGSDPHMPYASTNSIGMRQNSFDIASSNAARNVGGGEFSHHGYVGHDTSGDMHRVRSGSGMAHGGFEIDANYDNLADDLGLNPLIDVDEPTGGFPLAQCFDETHEPLGHPRHVPQPVNESDGTVSSVTPNHYDRQHLLNLYAHTGFGVPQYHDDNMDTKPPAIDFRRRQQQQHPHPHPHPHHHHNPHHHHHQQHYFHHQASNYPTQSAKNELTFDRKSPPVASLSTQSNRSSQENTAEANRRRAPMEAPLPRQGSRYSTRSTNLAKKFTTTKPRVNKVHSKGVKYERPNTRAGLRTKPTNPQYVGRSSSSQARRIQPSTKQLQEARTPRKLEALQTWFKRLQELIQFKDANGHTNVPQQYAKNHSLGIWVNKQRMEKKSKDAGKPSSLTDEKVQLLEEAGFVWAKRKGQAAWEEKFSELQQYLRAHGHCNVPTKNKTNRALGRWVSTQRSNYKKYKSGESPKHPRMDREELERRIQRLDGIGFSWSLLPGTTRSDDYDDSNEEDEEGSYERTNSTSPRAKLEDDDCAPSGNREHGLEHHGDGGDEDEDGDGDGRSNSTLPRVKLEDNDDAPSGNSEHGTEHHGDGNVDDGADGDGDGGGDAGNEHEDDQTGKYPKMHSV